VNLLVRWLVLWLALGLALRLAFLQGYPEHSVWPNALHFGFGLLNDLQSFVLVSGSVALFAFTSLRWFKVATFVAVAVAMLVCIAELFFWMEFESRLDRLVFHYLAYPKEVLAFLDEQFFLTAFRPTISARLLVYH